MPAIDLSPRDLATVRAILGAHVPGIEVRAFGSRARGGARPFSDLDLALMTARPLDLHTLAELREALTESDLPFKVDLLDWAATGEAFRRIVEQEGVVVQDRADGASPSAARSG